MNHEFNNKEERYKTIRKLCKIDLSIRKRINRIHYAFNNLVEAGGCKNSDLDFIAEIFSVDAILDLILDLILLNRKNDVNLEYFEDIWMSYVDNREDLDDDLIIDAFISTMEQEVMELDLDTLKFRTSERKEK